ncbi:TPA: hypothetical protein ACH3X2_000801 [Trebouxia sp. C0005]
MEARVGARQQGDFPAQNRSSGTSGNTGASQWQHSDNTMAVQDTSCLQSCSQPVMPSRFQQATSHDPTTHYHEHGIPYATNSIGPGPEAHLMQVGPAKCQPGWGTTGHVGEGRQGVMRQGEGGGQP